MYQCGGNTASGGCLLKLVVLNTSTNQLATLTLNGVIDMSGAASPGCAYSHAGAGAGGTILLEAQQISGTGTLNAIGGSAFYGGAGGGGIVSLIADTSTFTGTTSVINGNGVPNGLVTITAPPTSGY
jgi:hypothetical protein